MPDLLVDWCSIQAARYAVMHWHYSKSMPIGKVVSIGAWEDQEFIGAVAFAWGANRNIGRPYGLNLGQCAELVRVALTDHQTPVSAIVSRAVKLLRQGSPGLRLLLSYADPMHQHHGGIYQAMNWLYLGVTPEGRHLMHNGQVLHRRAYTGDCFKVPRSPIPQGAEWVHTPGKHRYALPLDKAMRRQVLPLAVPFPPSYAVQGSEV